VAALLATTRTLRSAKPLKITLNGHERLVWMLFVGNGPYEPKGFGAARRPSLAAGKLDVRYLRADLPYSRARFLLATLTGTLSTSHVYRHAEVSSVDVVLLDGNRRIALDGEVGPLGRRFSFRVRERALPVYAPLTSRASGVCRGQLTHFCCPGASYTRQHDARRTTRCPPTSTYLGTGNRSSAASATACSPAPPAHSTRFASESVAIAHNARAAAPDAEATAVTHVATASATRVAAAEESTVDDERASSTRPSGCTNSVVAASAGSATRPPRTNVSATGPSSTELAEYHHSTPVAAGLASRNRAAVADSAPASHAGSVTATADTGCGSVMP
jgi:hypothetical protein